MLGPWRWQPHAWDGIAGSPGNSIRNPRIPVYENGIIISNNRKWMWPWLQQRADTRSVKGRLGLERSSSHHLLGNLNQQNQLLEDSFSYQGGYWASAWCCLTKTPACCSQKDSVRWRIKQRAPTKYCRLWVKLIAWSVATWLQSKPLALWRVWDLAEDSRRRNQHSWGHADPLDTADRVGTVVNSPQPYSLLQLVTQHRTQSKHFTSNSMWRWLGH